MSDDGEDKMMKGKKKEKKKKSLGLVVSDNIFLTFSSRKSIYSLCDLDMQWT